MDRDFVGGISLTAYLFQISIHGKDKSLIKFILRSHENFFRKSQVFETSLSGLIQTRVIENRLFEKRNMDKRLAIFRIFWIFRYETYQTV